MEKNEGANKTSEEKNTAPVRKPATSAAGTGKATPVRKKKIIIVTNGSGSGSQKSQGYSSQGGSRQGQGSAGRGGANRGGSGGRRPARGGQRRQENNAGVHHLIKPKTAPSQMSVDFHTQEEIEQDLERAKKQEEAKKAAAAKAAAEKAAAEKAAQPAKAEKAAEPQPAKPAEVEKAAKPAEKVTKPAEKVEKPAEKPVEKQRPTHYDLSNPDLYRRRSSSSSSSSSNNSRSNGERRSYGNNGGNRGGYQGRGNNQGGGFQGRGGRPGQGGPNARRGGSSFGGRNSGPSSNEENGSRRRNNQARDKRNKKDVAFASDEMRERHNRSGRFQKPVIPVKEEKPEEKIKVISIPEKLTIRDLADAMHMQPSEIIKKLFLAGKVMTVNSELTFEEAEDIAADYDILCEKEEKVDEIQELLKEDEEDPKNLVPRPPVVVVMGHVDHGKTSLLDYIRKTNVTSKEAGGITQAIGAYTAKVKDRTITFLDTPGHEAFTAMRLRGAMATDIAVLVVAADDGVMPQTIEAINHAKAAGVEIIVAVNKCDKPDADPDRVRQQLTKYGLIPSDWGGQTEFVNVSAKTGMGIDDLLDTILLQADVMELTANPNRLARGIVLEAKLDKGKGPVANVLVQKGTLHVGDFISAGQASGKVRALINEKGKNIKSAGPSFPAMVLGLNAVPSAGETIVAHKTNDEAKQFAETYKAQHKEELVEENRMSMNVEDLFDQMREGKMKELELIVKADVQGSVEALCASLLKLSNDEVKVRIIHSAVGNISESDVSLAAASNAAIIGFNVVVDPVAKTNAENEHVSIHLYKVIYEAIDDVDAALKGMLAPVYEEKVIGHAEVRQLFKSGKIGNIAGSYVTDGVVEKDSLIRIRRGDEQIYEGSLASLKRFKDDVKEVKAGYECGLVFKDFDSMQVGDTVEAYKMVEVPREQVIAMKEAEKKQKEDAEKAANK